MALISDSLTNKGYNILKFIGKGQFGSVYKASKNGSTEEFAIKAVDKKNLNHPKLIELFQTEITIMKKISHPNILKCFESFEDQNCHYLVLQYCNGGDLNEYLLKHKKLNETEAIYFLKQIMNGFAELLKHKIMHRDFKPDNVYLHNDKLIIGDFGFAKSGADLTTTLVGTPITTAPEIQSSSGQEKYTNKIDIWSIGCTVYKMIFGQFPWDPKSKAQLRLMTDQYHGEALPFPDHTQVSDGMVKLLKRMIQKDPDQRIGWSELFNYPLLNSDSEKRIDEVHASLMFAGNKVPTDIMFDGNRKTNFDQVANIKREPTIKEIMDTLDYPMATASKVSDFGAQYKPAIDRLYHEKRITNFMHKTAMQLLQCSSTIPQEYKMVTEAINLIALLINKKCLMMNSEIVMGLLNETNMFQVPYFDKFCQSQEKTNILNELLKDNSDANEQMTRLAKKVQAQIQHQSDDSAQSLTIVNADNPSMETIKKYITNNLVMVLLCIVELNSVLDAATFVTLKTALASAWLCLDVLKNFKFFSEQGSFSWIDFEKQLTDKNDETTPFVEKIFADALERCIGNMDSKYC